MSPRKTRPPTEHEVWKHKDLDGRPYVEGLFRVGHRELTGTVKPDFEPDNGYLWGVTAPGRRQLRPRPPEDDPGYHRWKPPLAAIAVGGRCPTILEGQRKCEETVEQLRKKGAT